MYDAILFPTDGSDPSQQCLDHAVSLARAYDATLHAVFVVDQTRYVGNPNDVLRESLREHLHETGAESIDALEDAAEEAGVSLTTAVLEGVPAERIVGYAESNGIDLIVMGTHGRSGLDRVLVGSTTETVIRTSSIPVHCIPTGE